MLTEALKSPQRQTTIRLANEDYWCSPFASSNRKQNIRSSEPVNFLFDTIMQRYQHWLRAIELCSLAAGMSVMRASKLFAWPKPGEKIVEYSADRDGISSEMTLTVSSM